MIGSVRVTLGIAALTAGCSDARTAVVARQAEPLIWGGEQRLVASDAAELDEFGYSASLSGDLAIVGAPGESSFLGAAYVFARTDGSWGEEQKLVASDGAALDNFGWSVAIAADRAIVGAYGASGYRGAAYVFVRSGASWQQEQKLVASDGAELDQFGASVALAGDRVLVGAPGADDARGAAYVFVRSGSSWSEEQKLVALARHADDDFGYSVALAGDRALVGAPGHAQYAGAAHVFTRTGSSWSEEQELVASDAAEFHQLGNSVALAEDRALVGAYWHDALRGAAYVFARTQGAWSEEQRLVARDGADGDRFGNSLALDGDRAIVGAFARDTLRGGAYVFLRSGSAWSEEQRIVARDGAANDLFGWSVSLAGDRALIGANYADNLRGKAYVFALGLPDGAACSSNAHCASGQCVDQRCCATECEPTGTDGPAVGGCPDAARPGDGTCEPERSAGAPCDAPSACASGFCVDGVCCDAACDGLCSACTAALKGEGKDGLCGPIAAGRDPEDECRDDGVASCEANGLCDGAGSCARYEHRTSCEPEACSRGDDCTSGHCEDGICCDRVCSPSERCRGSLKVSGGDGTCGPARAASEEAPCRFDVQCTSGRCERGLCSASPAPNVDAGCSCDSGRTPRRAPGAWLGVALVLLLRAARRRPGDGPRVGRSGF